MRMSRAHWEELVAHAREEAPKECCGYMRIADGRVTDVWRARNERDSPYGYEIDGKSLLAANALDEQGDAVAIYHSHPKGPAEPSQTDRNLAFYPHWLYLIVSPVGEPEVRAWHIVDGAVEEEQIV